MSSYLIVTAVGPDHPGLVEELSERLAALGMNIESSRMAVLGGEFAVIMLVSGPESDVARLVDNPAGLSPEPDLQVFCRPAHAPSSRKLPPSLPFRIATAGMDHPGIVHDISRLLHRFEVNIETMDTNVTPAPVSGAPMFTMEAELAVPAAVKIRQLREALAELGDELNMDLEFEPRDRT